MRVEIRRIQEELGVTTIYVTHDQEEAMSLSDHVVVMNAGRIEQQGKPFEIYERPRTRFVAEFIGVTNLFPARVTETGARTRVAMLGGEFELASAGAGLVKGSTVQVVMRPEHLRIAYGDEARQAGNSVEGVIEGVSYLGAAASYRVRSAGDQLLTVHEPAPLGARLKSPGERATVALDLDRAYVLP